MFEYLYKGTVLDKPRALIIFAKNDNDARAIIENRYSHFADLIFIKKETV